MKYETKKRKRRRVILLCLLTVLFGFFYYIFASFNGSIIVKTVTALQARQYVRETYGTDYHTERCRYDFKLGMYLCRVQSDESKDTYFDVYRRPGAALQDNFDPAETPRENAILRLSLAMDDYAEQTVAEVFPHRTDLVICDFHDTVTEEEQASVLPDMPFDPLHTPIPCRLTVWTETEQDAPDWEEAAARLRELECATREALPTVESFSLTLRNPYAEQEDGGLAPETFAGEISVYDVPRSVITGDGLEAYLEEIRLQQEEEERMIEQGITPAKES